MTSLSLWRQLAALAAFALIVTSTLAGNSDTTTARLSDMGDSRTQKAFKSCRLGGFCNKDEKAVLLRDATKLAQAKQNGCKVRRQLRDTVALRCPSTAVVPYSVEDRVMALTDFYSTRQIGAVAVQQAGIEGEGVRIAILDTGIDATHPEISGAIAAAANFSHDASVQDGGGHGTHVAGIVAGAGAAQFDDRGGLNRVLGVAPGAELLIGKVCSDEGWCLESDVIAGLEWAVSQNAKVINLSLGGGSFLGHCDSDSLAQAVNWAVGKGASVVVAAGNYGGDGEGIITPACASKAIAVGAVDDKDERQLWSSYGTAIDVMAPGVDILSSIPCAVAGTCPSAGYGWWGGTSMAAPHVTGLIGQLIQAQPSLTTSEVYTIVTNTAVDIGTAGEDSETGYGRVNAEAAIAAAEAIIRSSSAASTSSSAASTSSAASSAPSSSTSSSSSSNSSVSSSSTPSSSSSGSETPSSSSSLSSSSSSRPSFLPSEPPREPRPDWSDPFRWLLPVLPDQASDRAREHRPDESRGHDEGVRQSSGQRGQDRR